MVRLKLARTISAVMLLMMMLVSGCSTTSVLTPQPELMRSEKYAAIVVDASNGAVLFERASSEPRYPASLTKMMTLYLLFEALDTGRLSLSDQLPVSTHAASQPPTKLGLKAGQALDIRSAILALCVRSANDVAVVVAESLGGTEENFAAMMTARARQLGMRATTFRNASGLPDAGQVTTARDMALLASALQKQFPHHYHYFSNTQLTYAGRVIEGHNKLLERVRGVDGIKTGYIRAAGYNIATSASRNGKRLIAVVMGGDSAAARDAHTEQLIEAYFPRARALANQSLGRAASATVRGERLL